MVVVLTHRHDFAATNDGYRCTGCAASITNMEIAANTASTGTPDAGHVWKKLHL